ncbi:MAG: L,D-transpeptidase family protein [Thalassobaculum sp.]|uniref:L,D-transpeptidase family protein n=1 Tax=Thalassobaculum sp. TaxID=2022740 RepID=UPI0032EE4FEA
MTLLTVRAAAGASRGILATDTGEWPCALGRGGLTDAKREGDGATPIGRFPLRRLFYRPDREPPPATALPTLPLAENLGWCDDPRASADYNRLVRLPFAPGHERMWRDDGLYDLVVELGYNDAPPVPGLGSAIFLHLARPDWGPTEGCVAMARDDLLAVLAGAGASSEIDVARR